MAKNTNKLLVFTACTLAITWVFLRRIPGLRKQKDPGVLDRSIAQFSETGGFSHIKYITVVIPSHNEYHNLCDLLPRIPKSACGHELGVLILDDGSSDETRELIHHHDIAVVSTESKRGQGAALRLGYALALAGGAEIVVTIDGDGQYQPEEIESVLKPVVAGEYDFVMGSRILGGFERDDQFRLIGVHFYACLFSRLLGFKITDSSSGYRAFRAQYLKQIVDRLIQPQYQTGEVLIEMARTGARIGEAPIIMLKRKSGKTKKGNNLYYGFAYARTIFQTWFKRKIENETIVIPRLPAAQSKTTELPPSDSLSTGGRGSAS